MSPSRRRRRRIGPGWSFFFSTELYAGTDPFVPEPVSGKIELIQAENGSWLRLGHAWKQQERPGSKATPAPGCAAACRREGDDLESPFYAVCSAENPYFGKLLNASLGRVGTYLPAG